MKLIKNKVARVFANISNKPIYILDWHVRPDDKTLVYYQEYGESGADIQTKVIN
ncbi:MAG: hypothetical protein NUV65_03540 [Candidatus Roizmanbacteria bacterium]|nr:hypothetical protein [Candidatus Roizmanbacteria bacterium]